jgi:hypothetical protein
MDLRIQREFAAGQAEYPSGGTGLPIPTLRLISGGLYGAGFKSPFVEAGVLITGGAIVVRLVGHTPITEWAGFLVESEMLSGNYLVGRKNGSLYLDPYKEYIESNYKDNAVIGTLSELNTVRFGLAWEPGPNITDEFPLWLEIDQPGFRVDFTVDPEKTQLYVHFKGRVFQVGTTYFRGLGDGTTLIENPVEVIESILRDECGLTNNELDQTSFVTAATSKTSWKSTYVIEKTKKISEILKEICYENGLILIETKDGKIGCVSVTVPTSSSGLFEVTNSMIVIKDDESIDFQEEYTNLYTIFSNVTTNYQLKIYESNESYGAKFETKDDSSFNSYRINAEKLLGREKSVIWNSKCIRDLNTLKLYLTDVMQWYSKPIRAISLQLTWDAKPLHQGQWVVFSSDSKISGTTDKYYFVSSYKINESEKTITVKLFEA